ncbi:MAG: hypothetical protein PUI76_02980 [Mollicutes bacterium]|nr:hypothetical protein [Mollicutes bacterium]
MDQKLVHSDNGIFRESKTVPVSGPNFFPQSLHSLTIRPVFFERTSLLTLSDPQRGHEPAGIELTNATSSEEGGRCFTSYHLESVETITPDEPRPSENLAFKAFFCLLFILAVPPFGERFPGTAKLQKGERPPKGFCYENLATALTAARE